MTTYQKTCANSNCNKSFTCKNECHGHFANVKNCCFCSECIKADKSKIALYSELDKTSFSDLRMCPQLRDREKVIFI